MADLETKLDKIDEKLDGIQVLQAVHTEQLKEHMRRSDLLERRIEQVDDEIKPIHKHVTMVHGIIRFIGIFGIVLSVLEALRRLLGG